MDEGAAEEDDDTTDEDDDDAASREDGSAPIPDILPPLPIKAGG